MRRPPYLPFLKGPPEFQVGLAPISAEHWLTPDTEASWIPTKVALLAERPLDVVATTPGSEPAQQEAAELVLAAVGAAPGGLLSAAAAVSDDLCVMEKRNGAWALTAAVLCAPSHWSLAANIGGPLTHLHGAVPDKLGPEGTQGLAHRIGRVFDGLQPGMILERCNWTIQADAEHFAPSGAPMRARAAAAPASAWRDMLHLRVERQTIRRLSKSGGVLFTIRVCIDPIRAVLAVEGAKQALARAWNYAPAHVRAYKHWAPLDHLVAAALA